MTTLQQTSGPRLFYQRCGRGAPVLLLHCTAGTGGSWQGLINELDDGFSFYTPDLAGYGRSFRDDPREITTLRDEAEFIKPLLWDVDEPFHLIGHSFGGAVALAAALAWPSRIKTLTLYEPIALSVLRYGEGEDRKKLDGIRRAADDMQRLVAAGSEHRAMSIFADFWNGAGAWDHLPESQRDVLCQLAKKVVDDFRIVFDKAWNTADFGRLHPPVTILRGDRSPPVALRVAEVLAEFIPRAQLITIPKVGHMAPVTHPQRVAPAIMECLSPRAQTAPALQSAMAM